jgi:hypothetical protein
MSFSRSGECWSNRAKNDWVAGHWPKGEVELRSATVKSHITKLVVFVTVTDRREQSLEKIVLGPVNLPPPLTAFFKRISAIKRKVKSANSARASVLSRALTPTAVGKRSIDLHVSQLILRLRSNGHFVLPWLMQYTFGIYLFCFTFPLIKKIKE